MNLLEELLGYQVHQRKGVYGRRTVQFEARLEKERKRCEELALKAAKEKERAELASSRHLIRVALRDGRARFEGEICEVTCLRHTTVINNLHRLRKAGEVEQVYVGNFKLWSLTCKS